MSPRSSVYRTKPVIHADLGNSPKIHTEMNGGPPSIFQFPSLKTVCPNLIRVFQFFHNLFYIIYKYFINLFIFISHISL